MAKVDRIFRKRYKIMDNGVIVKNSAKDTIEVFFAERVLIVHRWWHIRGTYKRWKGLREALFRYRRVLTPDDVLRLARKYEFDVMESREWTPWGMGQKY